MENKKDGSVFIKEANKFLKNNNIYCPKCSKIKLKNVLRYSKIYGLLGWIQYIIRVKEMDSTEALIEIDDLIEKYKKEEEE